MLSGLNQRCCDQAETRFASHLIPGLWLVSAAPSSPLIGWLGPPPLAAWIWSDLRIWSVLSRLITAYLSPLYPHCYHTLSLSPASVSAASHVGAAETGALSLAFCHNTHYLVKQMSKVCWENKWSRSASFLHFLSLLQRMAKMWEISDFFECPEFVRQCHDVCVIIVTGLWL